GAVRARVRAQQPPGLGADPDRGPAAALERGRGPRGRMEDVVSKAGSRGRERTLLAPERAITPEDLHLFHEGAHREAWRMLGAQVVGGAHATAVRCAVWPRNARRVGVIGSFNGGSDAQHRLERLGDSGCWAGTFRDAGPGDLYKYRIESQGHGYTV